MDPLAVSLHSGGSWWSLFTESKLGLLQYGDARQQKGLLMAPLSPRDVTSCHVELFTFSRQCSQHCLFIGLLTGGACGGPPACVVGAVGAGPCGFLSADPEGWPWALLSLLCLSPCRTLGEVRIRDPEIILKVALE